MRCIRNTTVLSLFSKVWERVVAEETVEVSSLGRGQGLPSARHSQFQLALTNPPQSTAEPLGHHGGTSGKAYLRKSRKHHTDRGGGKTRVRNRPVNTKVRDEGVGGASGTGAKVPLQPAERNHSGPGISLQPVERTSVEEMFPFTL